MIRNFKSFNEAKMFDDYTELVKHLEDYLKDLYIKKPQEWRKRISSILESDQSYRSISYSISNFIEEIVKFKSVLENFKSDVSSHLKELEEVYQISKTLSSQDDSAYDQLEELDSRVSHYIDSIDEYLEELKNVAKSYLDIADSLPHLIKWDFKKFY